MRRAMFPVAISACIPLVLVAVALVASADEGSSDPQVGASPRIRPPAGVLRHVDAPTASPASAAARGELVVLVGGYQSCACPDDGTFDALRARLADDPRFTVVRFGTDPRFPYDTFGSISANGARLRDQVRAMSPGYSAVHIVTHSMGGNVADRAFAQGLSRADGVATYVSWAAPHDGSDAARGLAVARLAGDGALRESLLWLRMEADSPATRELAAARASAAPDGVTQLSLREALDVLVTARDARAPGVPTRTLDRRAEGHGGILSDPDAIDLTVRTITTRQVPPEERSRARVALAESTSHAVSAVVFAGICVLTCAACLVSAWARSWPRAPLTDTLSRLIPRASRKPCP